MSGTKPRTRKLPAVAEAATTPPAESPVAVVSSGTTIDGLTQAAVGQNVSLVQTTGSTITGDSKVAVLNSTGTATTLPFRVIAGIPETVNASGSYTEVIVKFNFGVHIYTTGVAVA